MFPFSQKPKLDFAVTELGLSFSLPPKLKQGMFTSYEVSFQRGKAYCAEQDKPFEINGVYTAWGLGTVVGAALESGIIQKWKCRTMPERPSTEDEVDLQVVYYVGPIVIKYLNEALSLPKVPFWRRVTRVLMGQTIRQN